MTPVRAGEPRPVSPRLANEALYRAVVAADRAPSPHDRRPYQLFRPGIYLATGGDRPLGPSTSWRRPRARSASGVDHG